jgi:hypothetical protein
MIRIEKNRRKTKMEKIEGIVDTIYEDFDTIEHIEKEKAVAFLLNVYKGSNKEKIIVVYDKNAVELGLIKTGEKLSCFGLYEGRISAIDSNEKVVEDNMFLCLAIMGDADIDGEKLRKQGAIRLR